MVLRVKWWKEGMENIAVSAEGYGDIAGMSGDTLSTSQSQQPRSLFPESSDT